MPQLQPLSLPFYQSQNQDHYYLNIILDVLIFVTYYNSNNGLMYSPRNVMECTPVSWMRLQGSKEKAWTRLVHPSKALDRQGYLFTATATSRA